MDAARRHLARLASSARPAGSPAEDMARRYCADTLAALGFTVTEDAFEYSTVPGRWATAAAGAISMIALASAGHLGSRGDATGALGVLGGVALAAAVLGTWIARHGILRLPVGRTVGLNLRASRGGADPGVWLVAHLDSKSQPVPIAARAVGIMTSAAVWLAALVVASAQVAGAPVQGWWVWIGVLGVVAALPVAASVVGGGSPGAADNASGVTALLLAAEGADPQVPVGILLTSAEELGLAGARAIAATTRPAVAINCDTVDDDAPLLCLTAGARSSRVADALGASARALGLPLATRRLLPGILVDAVALADAGWECATLSAATWRTLRRVHTSRDTTAELRGDGIVRASAVLTGALRALGERPR